MTRLGDASTRSTNGFNAGALGVTALVASALNLIVYGVGSAAGAMWIANGQSITWVHVIAATVIPVAIGWTITYFLARRWTSASTVMAWVGLFFGLVTAPAPLLSSDDSATGWALGCMHILTGIVWFVAVRPRRRPSGG